MIERQVKNILRENKIRKNVVTVITQVLVDRNDPAFIEPTKPVGRFYLKEEAELLADTVAIISKGSIVAMGSPGELIERNANYLVLTLQSVDEKIFEIVQKMGFALVPHDNHKNIKVRVEHTGDVRKILNALAEAAVSILSLDVRKPNLEEVFMKLTGEALREGPVERVPE